MNLFTAYANEGKLVNQIQLGLDEIIRSGSIKLTVLCITLLFILTFLAYFLKEKSDLAKRLLFIGFVLVALVNTVFLATSTIYLNNISATGGPVHWHADFQIWNCGEEVKLKSPSGISNRIGTPVLHEHGDKRIHVEGVVLDHQDVSLGEFFRVIGGSLTQDILIVPQDTGTQTLATGTCPDGRQAQLQVFIYKTEGDTYYQGKIQNAQDYILSPYSQVPSGDCVIIELDSPKEKTDKICTSYAVAEEVGKIHGR